MQSNLVRSPTWFRNTPTRSWDQLFRGPKLALTTFWFPLNRLFSRLLSPPLVISAPLSSLPRNGLPALCSEDSRQPPMSGGRVLPRVTTLIRDGDCTTPCSVKSRVLKLSLIESPRVNEMHWRNRREKKKFGQGGKWISSRFGGLL